MRLLRRQLHPGLGQASLLLLLLPVVLLRGQGLGLPLPLLLLPPVRLQPWVGMQVLMLRQAQQQAGTQMVPPPARPRHWQHGLCLLPLALILSRHLLPVSLHLFLLPQHLLPARAAHLLGRAGGAGAAWQSQVLQQPRQL